MVYHLLVNLFVEYADNLALDFFLYEVSLLVSQLYLSLGNVLHIARRVNNKYVFPVLISDPFIVYLVVVTEEDNVESRYLTCNSCCSVLLIVGGNDAAVFSRMEQSEDKVGTLHFLEILHPFLRTGGHLFELDTLPHVFCQPIWDSRGDHTDDSNLHSVNIMDGVGLQTVVDTGRTSGTVLTGSTTFYNVRSEQRTAHLTNPFVVDLMARLYVVVSYSLGIVLHIVDDRCCKVLADRHHIVRPVDAGLPLQDVAVVDKQQVIVTPFRAFLVYIGICT